MRRKNQGLPSKWAVAFSSYGTHVQIHIVSYGSFPFHDRQLIIFSVLDLLTHRPYTKSDESSSHENDRNQDSLIILPAPLSSPAPPSPEDSDLHTVKDNGLPECHLSVPQRYPQVPQDINNRVSDMGIRSHGREITCSLGWYSTRVRTTHYEPSSKELRVQVDIPWDFVDVIPTVTFTSPIPLSPKKYKSFCCPFVSHSFICPEATELVELSAPTSPKDNAQYVYSTQLIPEQWLSLVQTTGA